MDLKIIVLFGVQIFQVTVWRSMGVQCLTVIMPVSSMARDFSWRLIMTSTAPLAMDNALIECNV